MDRHASRHHVPDHGIEETSKEHQSAHQIRSTEQEIMHSSSQIHALPSYHEILAEKKRLKAEKERLDRKQREIRIEEKRIEDLTKLKEKIERKDRRCKKQLDKSYMGRSEKAKIKTVRKFGDLQKTKRKIF